MHERKRLEDSLLHERKRLEDSLLHERKLQSDFAARRVDALKEATFFYCTHFAEHRYRLINRSANEVLTPEERALLFKSLTFLEFMATLVENKEIDEKIFLELYGSIILKYYERWFRAGDGAGGSFTEELRTLAGQETLFQKIEAIARDLEANRSVVTAKQRHEQAKEFRQKSKGSPLTLTNIS